MIERRYRELTAFIKLTMCATNFLIGLGLLIREASPASVVVGTVLHIPANALAVWLITGSVWGVYNTIHFKPVNAAVTIAPAFLYTVGGVYLALVNPAIPLAVGALYSFYIATVLFQTLQELHTSQPDMVLRLLYRRLRGNVINELG